MRRDRVHITSPDDTVASRQHRRALLRAYNRKGVFGNLQDDRAGLERALAGRFERYELRVVGTVGLFAATVK